MKFSNHIINWYRENQRDLPWRSTKDPYKIWLSEIILQQTQVKQGLPYYTKFVSAFPNVDQLAKASEEEVLKLWQGLGYYSRARNLHYTAKYISKELNGIFPNTYNDIIKLKGVGKYTAAAISSFAFNQATPVLDGNVFRLLSRYFGVDTPINTTEGDKQFSALVTTVFNFDNPSEHNQAIMEFGALLCKPKSPDCMFCSLQSDCVAYQSGNVNSLPVKLKKIKRKKRHFNYFIITNKKEEFIIQQRLEKDIWQKLYEFPLIELEQDSKTLEEKDLDHLPISTHLDLSSLRKINSNAVKHVLSHQDIFTNFWEVQANIELQHLLGKNYILTNKEGLSTYAMPVLISKFIEQTFF